MNELPKLIIDVASAWLDTLLDVIDLLPKEVIKKEVGFKLKPPTHPLQWSNVDLTTMLTTLKREMPHI